jgi:hypothetical protein
MINAKESDIDVQLTYANLDQDKKVTIIFSFFEEGFGFGEIAIKQTSDGLFIDTERMSLDRVKKYLTLLLDSAILDTDDDPIKHAKFNAAMGRRCNGSCIACEY